MSGLRRLVFSAQARLRAFYTRLVAALPSGPSLVRRVFKKNHLGLILSIGVMIPGRRKRPLLIARGRTYSWGDVHREALRFARLFRSERLARVARGELSRDEPLAIGIYQENTPAYIFAVFGAAFEGGVVFALNTGARGETLASLLDRAGVRLLLTTPSHVERIEAVLDGRSTLSRSGVLLDAGEAPAGMRTLDAALADSAHEPREKQTRLRIDAARPLLVLYTSGTTGLPKGVDCSHLKLVGAGFVTLQRTGLRSRDRGYVSVPLFHANAWYLGVLPVMLAGGSFVLRSHFRASAFESDVLEHGVTYFSYIGQILHYVLAAVHKKHGTFDAAEAALAHDPQNQLRIAHGNGATPRDRALMARIFGMEHLYELYGSSEAVVTCVVRPGDPPESVGRIPRRVVILNERDEECPPARLDPFGKILNYDEAVGEICARTSPDNLLFDGYSKDPGATESKYRGGFFRSGDLGHVCVIGGRRYLYFDGRTDDWLRKDGENFSAESVARFAREQPGVGAAVAYGAPAPVADELVAVALQMQPGVRFDPDAAYAWYLAQQRDAGMDPKWMPDFIRVVDALPLSSTQKVLVRELKRSHYDPTAPGELYVRERHDRGFRPMRDQDFAAYRERFAHNGREQLLR